MKQIITFLLILLFSFSAVAQNAELVVPKGHRAALKSVAHTPDERLIASSSEGVVKIWDMASAKELKTFTKNSSRADILVTIPGVDGIGHMKDGDFYIIPASTLEPVLVCRISPGFGAYSMVASADGQFVYAAGSVSEQYIHPVIYKINLQTRNASVFYKLQMTGENTKILPHFEKLHFSSDNGVLYTYLASLNKHSLDNNFLLDPGTGAVIKQWKLDNSNYLLLGSNTILHTTVVSRSFETNTITYALNLVNTSDLSVKSSIELKNSAPNLIGNFQHHYDPSTGKLIFVANNEVVQLDLSQKKLLKRHLIDTTRIANESPRIFVSDYLRSSNNMVISMGGFNKPNKIEILNLSTFVITKKFLTNGPFDAGSISRHPLKNIFYLNGYLNSGYQQMEIGGDGLKVDNKSYRQYANLSVSPDGTKAAFYNSEKKLIGIFNPDKKTEVPRTVSFTEYIGSGFLVWSPDNKYLVFNTSYEIIVFDPITLKITRRLSTNEKFANSNLGQGISFSDDGKKLAVVAVRTSPANATRAVNYMYLYDVQSGILTWQTPPEETELSYTRFINNNTQIVSLERRSATFHYYDATTGALVQKLKAIPGQPDNLSAAAINHDGSVAVYAVGKRVIILDLLQKTIKKQFYASDYQPRSLAFLVNSNYFMGIYKDNSVHLFNISAGKEVARIITYENGNTWAAVSADNRFEGSDDAIASMYYAQGTKVLPLESLYEKFHTPRLVNGLIEGAAIEPPVVNVNTLKKLPIVSISYSAGNRNLVVEDEKTSSKTITASNPVANIKVSASSVDDVVDEVRLYHNGKLIGNTTRNLIVEDDKKQNDTKTFEVQLLPGQNLFKAVALNSQRTESRPDELIVHFKSALPVAKQELKPQGTTLYLVIIGINQYKNAKYNLNYAQADANGFKESISRSCGKIITQCKPVVLANQDAIKQNIVKAMQDIAKQAQPQDVFVFYYAGHGVMGEGTTKDFFLVPHDVTQLYGNEEGLLSKGLSSKELQDLSKNIQARKQLFILDACQSAGAIESIAMRGAAEEKAIAQLARSTGTHWLTASGSQQFASEFGKLGHGVFTYALLKGLSGEADSGDGSVSVNELKAYLEQKVPELTEQYKGTAQYPASYGYGNDFPVGVKE